MCVCVYPGKIAKEAILIFEREAIWNACATLDHVVALSEVSSEHSSDSIQVPPKKTTTNKQQKQQQKQHG